MKEIDELQFQDAVFAIPKNAVEVKFEIKTYVDDKLETIEGVFDLGDIREAFATFEKTVSGDYPLFTITEYGKELLDEEDNDNALD